MNREEQVSILRRLVRLWSRIALLPFILFAVILSLNAQRTHPGRGAISAQDLARMATAATSGSNTADQIASVTVNVAKNYANPISLTCTMPADLIEAACFVDPGSITGTGQVQLTVNTTPAHPLSSKQSISPGWLAAGGGTSLACILLFALPRRRWRNRTLIVLALMAAAFTAIGCGGSGKTDPGTTKGTYLVVVTASAGSGSAQYQTSVNIPITIQ